MKFSEKLRELRKSRNLTQENLANGISVSRTLITKYESGALYPTEDNLKRLADYFKVDIQELMSDEDRTDLALNTVNALQVLKTSLNIVALLISVAFLLLVVLPIFHYGHYVYPLPEGQTVPEYVHGYTSLMNALFHEGNPLALFSFLASLCSAVLTSIHIFVRDVKNKKALQIFSAILFGLSIVLFLLTFVYGWGIIKTNDFEMNAHD